MSENSVGRMGVPPSTRALPAGAKRTLFGGPPPWEATSPVGSRPHSSPRPPPYPVPCWFARRGQPVEVDLPGPSGLGIGVLWGTQVPARG